MTRLDYKCTCWGCRAPQCLPDAILEPLSVFYVLKHSFMPMFSAINGRWYVFRDSPDKVVEEWQDKSFTEDAVWNSVVSQAQTEYQLRVRKQQMEVMQ